MFCSINIYYMQVKYFTGTPQFMNLCKKYIELPILRIRFYLGAQVLLLTFVILNYKIFSSI